MLMRFLAFALLFGLASAHAAQAGAWLRGKGDGFASTSVSTDRNGNYSTSVYVEYGLSDSFTLGADLYYGSDLTTFLEGSGILFLRFPLGPTDRTNKFAAHVGVGARYLDLEYLTAREIGLSWGRGIQWRKNYGWINIDTSYNEASAPAETRVKLDATIGMGLTDRSKVMLQMFNTFEDGETYSRIAPSWLLAPEGGKTTYQFSVEVPVSGGGETYIKFGIWWDF